MDTQQGLWDDPLPDPTTVMQGKAGAGQPETAWDAALANPGGRGSMRLRIIQFWCAMGVHRGFTDDELAAALDMHLPSLTRRRDELVRLGWLEPYQYQGRPLTRPTRRGSEARVWTLSSAPASRDRASMSERRRRSPPKLKRYWQIRCDDWASSPVTDWIEADIRRRVVEDMGTCSLAHKVIECDKEGRPLHGGTGD